MTSKLNLWQIVDLELNNAGISTKIERDAETDEVLVLIPSLSIRVLPTTTTTFSKTKLSDGCTYIEFNPTSPTENSYFLQTVYNTLYGNNNILEGETNKEMVEFFRKIILCGIVEFTEILDTMPWKHHKNSGYKKFDTEATLEECADVFIYLLNLPMALGCGPEKFFDIVKNKQIVILQRLLAERSKI